jgi:hypothetical protein
VFKLARTQQEKLLPIAGCLRFPGGPLPFKRAVFIRC